MHDFRKKYFVFFWVGGRGGGGAAGDREPAIYTSSPGFAEKSSDIVTLSFIKN